MLVEVCSLAVGGTRSARRGFDLLAPHYRWMERVLAGSLLQACRTKYLSAIANSRKVLLLGEGPGRFLSEVIRSCPGAEITCLDSSAGMLEQARRVTPEHASVSFLHADVFAHDLGVETYDAVATHFFLDCFPAEQLPVLASRVARALKPGGAWLLTDFRLPASGVQRWRAAALLKLMYLFFRTVTALPARSLTNPDSYLKRNGLKLLDRCTTNFGLLHSDLWRKS
jgi:ubiquinone/menaquinone biosynthesis C-methylase UbiE